jgi:hypothetical protein
MRQSAVDMLAATEVPETASEQLVRGRFTLATQDSTVLAWSTGRRAQGDVLGYFVRNLQNGLSVSKDGKATADGITKLLGVTGVVDSLNAFSKLSTSGSATDAQLADAVEDVKKRIKLTVGGLAALDDRKAMGGLAATGVERMRLLLDSLSVDVAGQVASRIKGEAPPTETRLGGPRAVIDSVGVLGNYRQAALSSRDVQGLRAFTSAALGDYTSEKFAKDLLAATAAWDDASGTDLKDLPAGLTLNLAGRLTAWKKAAWPSKGQPDPDATAEAAFDVAEAVADYRRRIQNTPDATTSAASKATLLQLLDAVVGSVSQRLAALDA